MSLVIWHVTMSLDGYIAGSGDAMDWVIATEEETAIGNDVQERTGAIVAGRRWYDLASERWNGTGGIYGGAWSGAVFVLTHRPQDVRDDPTVTFVSDGIEAAVSTAREAAAGKSVGILGANTAQQAVAAGLVDEIVVHMAPVLLGDGIRFYGGPGAPQVALEPAAVAGAGQLVDLRYRVLN